MSTKHFSGRAQSGIGSSSTLLPVTPSDDADLPNGMPRAIHVGAAGSVAVMDIHGTIVTLVSLDGQYHPVKVRRVLATGTTATGIVALY